MGQPRQKSARNLPADLVGTGARLVDRPRDEHGKPLAVVIAQMCVRDPHAAGRPGHGDAEVALIQLVLTGPRTETREHLVLLGETHGAAVRAEHMHVRAALAPRHDAVQFPPLRRDFPPRLWSNATSSPVT